MEKQIKHYTDIYRKVLNAAEIKDIAAELDTYKTRLGEMYASEVFHRYSVYPSTNAVHVFAVIAMCLELKKYGYSDPEIIDLINTGFYVRRGFFRVLIRAIDLLPNAYRIAEKWNCSDHEKRVKDGSISYDFFNVTDGKIEYRISKCIYVEMFEHYGIRSLCKIFCKTDTTAYENLTRHVTFIRYSDLSDGSSCHDVIMKKQNDNGNRES